MHKKMSLFDEDEECIIYPSDIQPGSLMHSRTADKDIQHMIDTFKSDIEKEMKTQYSQIKAIDYQSRVVNGAIYHINVKTVPLQYFTVTIFHDMKTGKDSFSGILNVH